LRGWRKIEASFFVKHVAENAEHLARPSREAKFGTLTCLPETVSFEAVNGAQRRLESLTEAARRLVISTNILSS
jgi:hypothetical protein